MRLAELKRFCATLKNENLVIHLKVMIGIRDRTNIEFSREH